MTTGNLDDIRTGVRDDETRQTFQQLRKIFKDEPYVAKSLFDANTVLKADTDNTPEALTVAEQSVVGRADGDIDSLPVGTNELLGRAGGDLDGLAVGANEVVARGSANIAPVAMATDTVLGRAAGDIDDIAVAEDTVVGRVAGGHVTGLELVTAAEEIADPGSDSKIPTEAAVRAAISAGGGGGGGVYIEARGLRATWAFFLGGA